LSHRVENSELKREANAIVESFPCVQDSDNDSDELEERIDEMKCMKAQLLAEHGCVACVLLRLLGMITANATWKADIRTFSRKIILRMDMEDRTNATGKVEDEITWLQRFQVQIANILKCCVATDCGKTQPETH